MSRCVSRVHTGCRAGYLLPFSAPILFPDFQAAEVSAGYRYTTSSHAAPSQGLPTILNANPYVITVSAWGFRPEWADWRDVTPIINARAETVMTKPSFRTKRCLVLADGFDEWQRTGTGKLPCRIALKTGEPFAFAGIWHLRQAYVKTQGHPALIAHVFLYDWLRASTINANVPKPSFQTLERHWNTVVKGVVVCRDTLVHRARSEAEAVLEQDREKVRHCRRARQLSSAPGCWTLAVPLMTWRTLWPSR